MHKDLTIISMADITREEVGWLWHPYIPYGKLTIVLLSSRKSPTHDK